MQVSEVQVGSTITNGNCALRINERTANGWGALYISFRSGDMTGQETVISDEELHRWSHVPFEWRETEGGQEERYVWTGDYRALRREVRTRPLAMLNEEARIKEENVTKDKDNKIGNNELDNHSRKVEARFDKDARAKLKQGSDGKVPPNVNTSHATDGKKRR